MKLFLDVATNWLTHKILVGIAIFARPAGTRPSPTLMGQVLPGSIRNKVEYEFKKKNPTQVRVL